MRERSGEDPSDHPRVVAPPPLIYLTGLIVGGIMELLRHTWGLDRAVRFTAGPALVALGVFLVGAALREFFRAGTHVEVDRPATALVTTGPYHYSRNPIYIGLTLAYAGAAVLMDSLWVLVLVVPILLLMHNGVIAREEEYLTGKFGDAYRAYRRSVRRWV